MFEQTKVNKTFAEYATSTAFSISLTKLQCNALLCLEKWSWTFPNNNIPLGPHSVSTYQKLEARGFVAWRRDEEGHAYGFSGLTEAGMLMVKLLKQAGLTIENTTTLSTYRRAA